MVRAGAGQMFVPTYSARAFASKVTFVKKIYADGSTCQKCDFVWKQIEKDGLVDKIDRTIYLDERDTSSEGFVIAREHKIQKAPFFTVTEEDYKVTDKAKQIYEVYFKLKKDVFAKEATEEQKNEEIIRDVMKVFSEPPVNRTPPRIMRLGSQSK